MLIDALQRRGRLRGDLDDKFEPRPMLGRLDQKRFDSRHADDPEPIHAAPWPLSGPIVHGSERPFSPHASFSFDSARGESDPAAGIAAMVHKKWETWGVWCVSTP